MSQEPAVINGIPREFSPDGEIMPSTITAQSALCNPVHQVYFRAGLIAARESLARFVEAQDPSIAQSIRANWWPRVGPDLGGPRQLDWQEVAVDIEGGGATTADMEKLTPTLEALAVAWTFMEQQHLTMEDCARLDAEPIRCAPPATGHSETKA